MQILSEEEEEDAKPMARCEEKGQEWATHRQCGLEVQNQEDKPWESEELKKLEEDLPRLQEGYLAKAARACKARTGVGCDDFHSKSSVGLDKRNEERSGGSSWRNWNSVGNGRSKPALQCCS